MSDFLRPDGERIDNGDGTTTWVVEMGEMTENADLLVFGPAAARRRWTTRFGSSTTRSRRIPRASPGQERSP